MKCCCGEAKRPRGSGVQRMSEVFDESEEGRRTGLEDISLVLPRAN